ncbi:MAG: response regulator [Betaproteobacteria bacterium]
MKGPFPVPGEGVVKPPAILLVDDEPGILSAIRRLLRPSGYKVLTAEGAGTGLALLETEPVDLVISDMRMPEMDGAQFLERVRQRWPQSMRLLLTGYADVGSTIHAINRGEIYRYIAKPWDDNELLLTIRGALEQQRLLAENTRLHALTQAQNEQLQHLNEGLQRKVAERTGAYKQVNSLRTLAERRIKPAQALALLRQPVGKRCDPRLVEVFPTLLERLGRGHAHERLVWAEQLQSGMVLARDVVGDNGALLLAADLHLSPQIIGQMQHLAGIRGTALLLPIRVDV